MAEAYTHQNLPEHIVFLVDFSEEVRQAFYGDKTTQSVLQYITNTIGHFIRLKTLVNKAHTYSLGLIMDHVEPVVTKVSLTEIMEALRALRPLSVFTAFVDFHEFIAQRKPTGDSVLRVISFVCRRNVVGPPSAAMMALLRQPNIFFDVIAINQFPAALSNLQEYIMPGKSYMLSATTQHQLQAFTLRLVAHPLQRHSPAQPFCPL
eukprot:m.233782 g.233782  ORF g.233782 m.233782 type:complete len:206 (+) comp19301_c0_seq1:88-705(+)